MENTDNPTLRFGTGQKVTVMPWHDLHMFNVTDVFVTGQTVDSRYSLLSTNKYFISTL